MVIHTSLDTLNSIKNPVVTTGTFDGVHIGHQKILSRINNLARKINGESVLFTFHPHPRTVLFPNDHGLKLLNTIEERIKLLEKSGLDHLIIYPFSKEFSRLSALQYVRDIMVNEINVHTIVVGYDHHFGKNREGDLTLLKEFSQIYEFDVEVIEALDIEEINVSSTKVRRALTNGEVHLSNVYLGHNYTLSGIVVKGEQRGRQLGFNTANINISESTKLIPKEGVYACTVKHDEDNYVGMLNIGSNPTFNDSGAKSIEVHIIDFDKDIYGETLELGLVKRLRNEQKFESPAKLVQQLEEDKLNTLQIVK